MLVKEYPNYCSHATRMGWISNITECHRKSCCRGQRYDVVLNMEVIEHVADINVFMEACGALVQPGGDGRRDIEQNSEILLLLKLALSTF